MLSQVLRKDDLPDGVAEQIRTQILSGTLAPGDTVPPERELAARFGVNRTTVREAMRELEYAGLVARFQGKGCVVLDYREHGSLELLRYLMHMKDYPELALEAANSMIDAFRGFYVSAVGLVIRRASEEDMKHLYSLANKMLKSIASGDNESAIEADHQFHRAFAKATHSIAYELELNNFLDIESNDPDQRFRPRAADAFIRIRANEETLPHYRLSKALLSGDIILATEMAENIVDAMRKSLTVTN